MTLIDSEDQDSLLNDLKEFSKEESFMACGGSATNTIIAASNFGSNCYYSCRGLMMSLGILSQRPFR